MVPEKNAVPMEMSVEEGLEDDHIFWYDQPYRQSPDSISESKGLKVR